MNRPKIIVTGLESSGTKWMTKIIGSHPDVREAIHTSIPENLMCHPGGTKWPELRGASFVVWVMRYERFRLLSIERLKYNDGRPEEFLPPNLYQKCEQLYDSITCPVIFVQYGSLVGPLGRLVLKSMFKRMGLRYERLPVGSFDPVDENAKYLD